MKLIKTKQIVIPINRKKFLQLRSHFPIVASLKNDFLFIFMYLILSILESFIICCDNIVLVTFGGDCWSVADRFPVCSLSAAGKQEQFPNIFWSYSLVFSVLKFIL